MANGEGQDYRQPTLFKTGSLLQRLPTVPPNGRVRPTCGPAEGRRAKTKTFTPYLFPSLWRAHNPRPKLTPLAADASFQTTRLPKFRLPAAARVSAFNSGKMVGLLYRTLRTKKDCPECLYGLTAVRFPFGQFWTVRITETVDHPPGVTLRSARHARGRGWPTEQLSPGSQAITKIVREADSNG